MTKGFKIVVGFSESRYMYPGSTFWSFRDFDKAAETAKRCEVEFDGRECLGYCKTDFVIYMDGCDSWKGCYGVGGRDPATLFDHLMFFLQEADECMSEEVVNERKETIEYFKPKFEKQKRKEDLRAEILRLENENRDLNCVVYRQKENEEKGEKWLNEYAAYHFETDKNDKMVVMEDLDAEVVKGVSLKFHRSNPEKSITFYLGDSAIHGSYNRYYFGEITKITEKNVFVDDYGRTKRMPLARFSMYNSEGHEKAHENNRNWTD